jgi:5-methylcytosine-specific restriction protein A
MEKIAALMNYVSKNYLAEKEAYSKAMKTVPSWSKIVDELPHEFKIFLGLPSTFKVAGSIGQGRMTEIPWVCFFDKEITTSPQTGFYIALLFKTDMSGFYISLNQGWTQYEEEFGIKKGKIEIKENTIIAQENLKTIRGFNRDSLNLGATRALGKGYELGNIASKYFPLIEPINEEELTQSFRSLFSAYMELKGSVGTDILSIKTSISEDSYQATIQTISPKKLNPGPISKKRGTTSKFYRSWNRDAGISKEALDFAGFSCEVDASHLTFISKASGNPFMEAHHLIPMTYQDEFTYSIDVPENIISLCPNCHRKIHLSALDDKSNLLEKFYRERVSLLNRRGIEIDKDKLLQLYK